MSEIIPVVISFDENYLIPALMTVRSIIDTCSDLSRIEFVVLHRNLDQRHREVFAQIVFSYGSIVSFIDCTERFKELTHRDERKSEVFLMLLVPQLFADRKHVIVIDTDVLVRDDILKTVHELPHDKKLGAVRCMLRRLEKLGDVGGHNHYAAHVIGIEKVENYFNSGFVVFNMQNVTKEDAEACISLLSKKWQSDDEAILNYVFQHSLHLFPLRWNFYVTYYNEPETYFSSYVQEQFLEGRDNAAICHFIADYKPWRMDTGLAYDNKYRQEYRELWKSVKEDFMKQAALVLGGRMWKAMNRV